MVKKEINKQKRIESLKKKKKKIKIKIIIIK